MISWRTFFWLVGGEIIGSQHHQPPASKRSGVYMLVGSLQSTSPTGGGFSICNIAQWYGNMYPWFLLTVPPLSLCPLPSVIVLCVCVCAQLLSHPTLCDPMDYIPPGSSVHEISQKGDLPDPGVERLWHLLYWQVDSLPLNHLGSFFPD